MRVVNNKSAPSATRRRFLILASAGGAALAGVISYGPHRVGSLWRQAFARQDSDSSAPSAIVAEHSAQTAVAFMSALFGHPLTQEDRTELLERLAYTVTQLPHRAADYALLASGLDRMARDAGAASFIDATESAKATLVEDLMRIDPTALRFRVLKRLSSDYAREFEMRIKTVPALALLYKGSGVPWRARGYHRWPGIPGDWREIVTPGNPYP
jgi:hypothetical protein